MTDLAARLRDELEDHAWDTLTLMDFQNGRAAARLCPLCGAWVWSEDKHRDWHLDTDPRLTSSSSKAAQEQK